MSQLPIEHHGVIGDLHTVALVGIDGTIDWLCLPNFDSPSVFARLLDVRSGGHFTITAVSEEARRRQMYLPDTNVLLTRFLTPDGVGEIVDFMPIRTVGGTSAGEARRIVRLVRGVRGAIPMRVACAPAFDYARSAILPERTDAGFRWCTGTMRLELLTSLQLRADASAVGAEFLLRRGDEIAFVLDWAGGAALAPDCLLDTCRDEFRATVRYWQAWVLRSHYQGRWREMVKRSCLVLKLLTFAPTGAIVAAPTTSLPERIGGGRNWDYRYTWLRDAAFTLHAFIRVGFADEAEAFMRFIEARCRELAPGEGLRVLYGIHGQADVPESELSHLEGYRGSTPVRIGNDAAHQLQLDIVGELIDSLYLFNKHCQPFSHDIWCSVRRLSDWVCDNWQQPDEGIWETRSGRRHYTFSKMMCWVALDRSHRIALKRGLPADRVRWLENRDAIYEAIMERGFSSTKGSFVQAFDTDELDASMLLAPMVKFVAPTDPRMLGTLDAVGRELVADSLVHRYDPRLSPDGVGGAEGTFSMCTFWLAEALARAGRLEDARLTFEKMLGYANHVGLYSEEIGPTGDALGNFPQALTHLGLISAATYLSHALDGEREATLRV